MYVIRIFQWLSTWNSSNVQSGWAKGDSDKNWLGLLASLDFWWRKLHPSLCPVAATWPCFKAIKKEATDLCKSALMSKRVTKITVKVPFYKIPSVESPKTKKRWLLFVVIFSKLESPWLWNACDLKRCICIFLFKIFFLLCRTLKTKTDNTIKPFTFEFCPR